MLNKIIEKIESGYFKPKSWAFWRSLITAFVLVCMLGHWLELLYCTIMDNLFGIVEGDYVVWSDPWYHPYWVYGFGAIFMTFFIEPIKEKIVEKRKTVVGAVFQTLIIAIIISCALELIFGLLVNQPDEFGVYPYWDNSNLPFNILGQAWLVNDFFIGVVATIYVWIIYPLICKGYSYLKRDVPNIVFALIIAAFIICCVLSYSTLICAGIL